MKWVARYPGVLVELTGGEPLLQEGIYPLLAELLAAGRTVLIETNGSFGIGKVPCDASIILDIKCPGSGVAGSNDRENIRLLSVRKKHGSRDEIKFVLTSEEDYNWARSIIAQHGLTDLVPLLLSPVSPLLSPARLAEWMMRDRLPVRLQLQLHRIIWPEAERGV